MCSFLSSLLPCPLLLLPCSPFLPFDSPILTVLSSDPLSSKHKLSCTVPLGLFFQKQGSLRGREDLQLLLIQTEPCEDPAVHRVILCPVNRQKPEHPGKRGRWCGRRQNLVMRQGGDDIMSIPLSLESHNCSYILVDLSLLPMPTCQGCSVCVCVCSTWLASPPFHSQTC